MKEQYKSRVYTERPDYADFDAPAKFQAIQSIIAKRIKEHPKAICSYSGGSDSDILIDMIERTRAAFNLPPVKYTFFNTGLEMKATRDHVKTTAEKYGVEIEEHRPKVNIVQATRQYGVPFVSKIMSKGLSEWQKKGIPLTIAQEYEQAEDKAAKRKELKERYPKCESVINFLCCCNSAGEPYVIGAERQFTGMTGDYLKRIWQRPQEKKDGQSEKDAYVMIVTAERAENKMIMCDTCPRCKDEYPGKVDWAGNHFCICGMSGNKVYTMPRREPRLSGHGYIHYGIGSCGLYNSVDDALRHMTKSEIKRWMEGK